MRFLSTVDVVTNAAATDGVRLKVAGDAAYRCVVNTDGTLEWGDGTNATDATLGRSAAGALSTNASLTVSSATSFPIKIWADGNGSFINMGAGATPLGYLQATSNKSGLAGVDARPVAVSFTNSTFDIMSGGFAGTQVAQFGATYLSIGAAPASNGTLRLPNATNIQWRNPANDGDGMWVNHSNDGNAHYNVNADTSHIFQTNGYTAALTTNQYATTVHGYELNVSATGGYIKIGAAPAGYGAVRLPNATDIVWKSSTGTGDGMRIMAYANDTMYYDATAAGGAHHFRTGAAYASALYTNNTATFVYGYLQVFGACVTIGTTPSTYGTLRMPSGGSIALRSKDNDHDVTLYTLGPVDDVHYFGSATNPFCFNYTTYIGLDGAITGAPFVNTGRLGLNCNPFVNTGICWGNTVTAPTANELYAFGSWQGGLTLAPYTGGAAVAQYVTAAVATGVANTVDYLGIWHYPPTKTGTGTVANATGAAIDTPTIGTTNYTLRLGTNAAGTTQAAGIVFRSDLSVNLYPSAADTLKTDDNFVVGGACNVAGLLSAQGSTGISVSHANGYILAGSKASADSPVFLTTVTTDVVNRYVLFADGKQEFGDGTNARDTNLYRSAANVLKTDDAFTVGGAYVAVGTNAAATGAVRLANNYGVFGRNVANNGDIRLVGSDISDNVILGATGVAGCYLQPGGVNAFWATTAGSVSAGPLGLGTTPYANTGISWRKTVTSDSTAWGNYMGELILSPADTYSAYAQHVTAYVNTGIANALSSYIGLYVSAPTKVGGGTVGSAWSAWIETPTIATYNHTLHLGPNVNGTTESAGILFRQDGTVNLYPAGVNILKTDDAFHAVVLSARTSATDGLVIEQADTNLWQLRELAGGGIKLTGNATTITGTCTVGGAYVSVGTNPASAGAIRIPSEAALKWRNAANNADGANIYTLANDSLILNGSGDGIYLYVGGGSQGVITSTYASLNGFLEVKGDHASIGTNPASAGAVRLPNTQAINWRNAANNADTFSAWVHSDNNVYLDTASGTVVTTRVNGANALQVGLGYAAVGTNPASAGAVRIPNNTSICWRNAANSADYGLTLNTSNNLVANTNVEVTGTLKVGVPPVYAIPAVLIPADITLGELAALVGNIVSDLVDIGLFSRAAL